MADVFFPSKNVLADETVAIGAAATTLTAATYSATSAGSSVTREYPVVAGHKAAGAVMENIGTENIYYTFDGSTPTSSNGHVLGPADVLPIYGFAKLAAFKGVRSGASNVNVYVTYYK